MHKYHRCIDLGENQQEEILLAATHHGNLPFKARGGSGKSTKPEQEAGEEDLREKIVILLSFYNVILICCLLQWLSLLEAEDTETSEDKELQVHGAQEMAYKSCVSLLTQGLEKLHF